MHTHYFEHKWQRIKCIIQQVMGVLQRNIEVYGTILVHVHDHFLNLISY